MTHVTHDPWVTGAVTPAQALHRFIDYPALYLDIVYVHTPLSCYIIAQVIKLHTQAPVSVVLYMCRYYYFTTSMNLNVNVNLELRQSHAQLHMHHRLTRYIIIATVYTVSPAIELTRAQQ